MRSDIALISPVQASFVGLQVMRGRIVSFNSDSAILIESEDGNTSLVCNFLRTSTAPLPIITQGDIVLYMHDAQGGQGCILGIVEKYVSQKQPPNQFKINALERIEICCGKSSLTMSKEGKVILKGDQLLSRAAGINKIKGAAVKIN